MKTEKKRWHPSPSLVVLTTAVMVIAVTILLGWLNARRYRVNARVEIADPAVTLEVPTRSASLNTTGLPDSEVARMAMRVREATGLLMGLSVLAVSEQMSNRTPLSVNSLVSLMSQRRLLPPGINHSSAKGVLESDRSMISLRYRPQPIGLEVVSVGRESLDGPPVIVRLITGGDDNSSSALLVAKKIEGVALPRLFAPLNEIAALGWSIEPLRERSFAQQEIDQLNNWARQYAATGK
jgi:hypothetical protein